MREVQIALGIIEQNGKYLMQLRDGDKRIGAAGLIGCFGGKLDDGEEPKLAFCREIAEETSIIPDPGQVDELGMVHVESDHQYEPVRVVGHVFQIELPLATSVIAKEGKLVVMSATEARAKINSLTPATRAIFEQFIPKGT